MRYWSRIVYAHIEILPYNRQRVYKFLKCEGGGQYFLLPFPGYQNIQKCGARISTLYILGIRLYVKIEMYLKKYLLVLKICLTLSQKLDVSPKHVHTLKRNHQMKRSLIQAVFTHFACEVWKGVNMPLIYTLCLKSSRAESPSFQTQVLTKLICLTPKNFNL